MYKDEIKTFEQIPYALNRIMDELRIIKDQIAIPDSRSLVSTKVAEKKILTAFDVCNLLDLKISTLYSLTHQNKIPFYKTNGRIYFDANEIDEWIRTGRRKTIDQLRKEATLQLKNC